MSGVCRGDEDIMDVVTFSGSTFLFKCFSFSKRVYKNYGKTPVLDDFLTHEECGISQSANYCKDIV